MASDGSAAHDHYWIAGRCAVNNCDVQATDENGCYTMPDGSCVSEGPCLHTPPSTAATVGSLFSGIGGLDLGLERAGMRVVWQAETKPHAAAVLARQWPDVPNHGDVTTVDWRAVERPWLLCGGFPCQDLSHAHTNTTNGARAGLAGPASSLWGTGFVPVIAELEPEWVIVENVNTWRSWVPTVRADLADLGYASMPVELSAGSFGAPHRRPRCFVVANTNCYGEPLLALHAEVEKLRPVSGPDSRDWRDAPSRAVLLDDGVPDRVGQNDAYGNAVVPAVAEWLGRQILALSMPLEEAKSA